MARLVTICRAADEQVVRQDLGGNGHTDIAVLARIDADPVFVQSYHGVNADPQFVPGRTMRGGSDPIIFLVSTPP